MVRAMIVLLLLGSAFLGWNYFKQAKLIERYEKDLAAGGKVEQTVWATQEQAHKYAAGLKQAEDEGVDTTQDNQGVVYRIRQIARSDKVRWGGITSPKSREVVNGKYIDETYQIKHTDKGHTVTRLRIANLFQLLEGLRNLHVVGIKITPQIAPKDGEIPVDRWKCDFEVVKRSPKKPKKK